MSKTIIFILLLSVAFFFNFKQAPLIEEKWTENTPVYEVLKALGESPYKHDIALNDLKVKQGEELVKLGRTALGRKRTSSYISKYYACTSCHNLEQEDPDLRFSNPDTRLGYVKEKGIPFLQATTFKGVTNRESWYNDDYVEKYGAKKIAEARSDLRAAIQLCAVECAQGRSLKKWEEEAILSYLWSLQFNLGDLDLSSNDLKRLNTESTDSNKKESLRLWLKTFYAAYSPAHFNDTPSSKEEGYKGLTGNAENGKNIYELSCLHCHKDGGVSHYTLDNSILSFRDLERTIPKNSHFSLYQIVAYGTYAIPGHKPYMPHFPIERMSKQQIEDLRAYIELKAN